MESGKNNRKGGKNFKEKPVSPTGRCRPSGLGPGYFCLILSLSRPARAKQVCTSMWTGFSVGHTVLIQSQPTAPLLSIVPHTSTLEQERTFVMNGSSQDRRYHTWKPRGVGPKVYNRAGGIRHHTKAVQMGKAENWINRPII